MRELGRTSPRPRHFAERALAHPRSFALNVSKGTAADRVYMLGRTVQSFHSLAEIRERHALRIAVMSLADTISFGLCADPTLIVDVNLLAEHIQHEAALPAGRSRVELNACFLNRRGEQTGGRVLAALTS